MEVVVAIAVASILNVCVLAFLQRRYDPSLFRVIVIAYLGSVTLRYVLAFVLWLALDHMSFAQQFWGDSAHYDRMGAAVAEAWSHGGSANSWASTIEGRTNRGFIYFVAVVYYVFGRNTLVVQLINGVIGTATAIVILEIGLLLYDRRTAVRAMLLTAFFPQMLFWSAALYKDGAVMFCIALNMLALLRLKKSIGLTPLILYTLSAAALIFLRFYIFLAVVIAASSGFLVWQKRGPIFSLASQLVMVAGLLVLLLMTPVGQELMATSHFFTLEQLQVSRSDLARTADSGFAEQADVSTIGGLLRVLPIGVLNLLFAPFPWSITGLRQSLALPDVIAWYLLMPALLRGLFGSVRDRLGQAMPILVFTTSLTLAYGAFLGNVGTAYRQRTQVMMFYFLFIADGLKRKSSGDVSLEDEEGKGVEVATPGY